MIHDPPQIPGLAALSVRCLPRTERWLQSICTARGLTLWGEAAARVLPGLLRAAPRRRDACPAYPRRLLQGRAGWHGNQHAVALAVGMLIAVDLPEHHAVELRRLAARWGLPSAEAAAAVLLYAATPRGAA